MSKELKSIRSKNSKALERSSRVRNRMVRHFCFTATEKDDPISFCLCGDISAGVVKHNLRGVDCPQCLSVLDRLANVDSHKEAIAIAKSVLPKVINPDQEVMKETHGSLPTRNASRHIKARAFLDSKLCDHPNDMPGRMIGNDKLTLYKNLYENGLIDEDGDRTSLDIEDLAKGKKTIQEESIVEAS